MYETCELCIQKPAVYCLADEARLCWTCDADVHGANFLVARHMRSLLCQYCGGETDCQTSGSHPTPLTRTCAVCSPAYVQASPAHAHGKEGSLVFEKKKSIGNNVLGGTDRQLHGKRSRDELNSNQKVCSHAGLTASKPLHYEGARGHAKDSRKNMGATYAVKRIADDDHARGASKMRKGRAKRLKSPVSVISLSMSSGATTECDNAVENSDLTDITEGSSSPPPVGYLKLFG